MSPANLVIFPFQDVLGLNADHRMNIPGTLGTHNWSWRFHWAMVGAAPAARLAGVAAASGRAPLALLKLPA
jgi:4-alpha-glucanotransferase